jgi:hypothetical protein
MSKRYLVLGLSAVLALAVAVPAIGQSSDPTATTTNVPKKFKKKVNRIKRQTNQNTEDINALQSETGDLNVRVTNLEAAGPGTPGAPGAPGTPGAPGEPGTAGPGQAFSFSLDNEDATVTGDGFTLTFEANNAGVCQNPVIDNTASVDGGYWLSDLEDASTDVFFELGTGGDSDDDFAAPDDDWFDVTAMHPGAGGRAQFQFVQKSSVDGDCIVAGSVIAS